MLVCTFRTPDTHAAATVLARQVHQQDPSINTVVIDLCRSGPKIEYARLATPEELGTTALLDLALISRTAEELTHHLAPHIGVWALEQDELVLFVSPQTLLIDKVATLAMAAREHGLALVPHMSSDLHEDGQQPTPRDVLAAGIINDGLWAATRAGLPALRWWRDRTSAEEIAHLSVRPEMDRMARRLGLPRRVLWADALPELFASTVLSESGWGLSPWNLSATQITFDGERGIPDANGAPVRSLEFRELDIDRPWIADWTYAESPRFRWSDHPNLWAHCSPWIEAMKSAHVAGLEYRYARLPDGTELDSVMRFVYEATLGRTDDVPVNPFVPENTEDFLNWIAAPAGNSKLSRYLHRIWLDRADLQGAFPRAPHRDAQAFRDWARDFGSTEERIPERFLAGAPSAAEATTQVEAPIERIPGVLVSGYLNSVMGLGEAARLVVGAVVDTGLDHATFTYTTAAAEQAVDQFLDQGDHALHYDTHVACVNIDTFTTFASDLGPAFFDGRYTIGLWFWETSIIPDEMLPAFDLVDEIWVAASYVGDIMRAYTDKPIRVFPQPVPIPERGDMTRAELGLPDDFTFLFAFDFNSVIERKNPLGLVRAFREAFAPGEGPQLVLKTINGGKRVADYERLVAATADRDDIRIVDAFFPAWKRDAWTAECDCYVSLHRSEGFGLTMAEAMASGKPVIASRYSANLEFMNDDNSLLVDVTEARVPAGCAPYPEGAIWAEPDVSQAAAHMRRIYSEPELRERLGAAGREFVTTRHTSEAMSEWVKSALLSRPEPPVVADEPSPSFTRRAAGFARRRVRSLMTSIRS